MAVHDAGLDLEPLLARAHCELLQHGRGQVRRHACAPRRAAGMLRAPLPAATSRNRIPERSWARRKPSVPSHMCVGVTFLSYPAAIRSHAVRVSSSS